MADLLYVIPAQVTISVLAALLVGTGLVGSLAVRTPPVLRRWARRQAHWQLWGLFCLGLFLIALSVGLVARL